MIPPLLKLKAVGLLCPCLENDEDSLARSALSSVSGTPVRWHRRVKSSPSVGGGGSASVIVGGLVSGVSGLFGSASKSSGGGEESGTGSAGAGGSWAKERAVLRISDSARGPAIVVETVPDEHDLADDEDLDADPSGEMDKPPPKVYTKSYSLARIGTASAVDGSFFGMGGGGISGVVIASLPPPIGNGEEVLRFDVLNNRGKPVLQSDRRDDVVQKLTTLIEWDRRRRANAGEAPPTGPSDSDDEEDEEEDFDEAEEGGAPRKKKGGMLKGKAEKVAHFARREIEMREQRREREKRKARYLEGSGGLKYTAIAMANKEMS